MEKTFDTVTRIGFEPNILGKVAISVAIIVLAKIVFEEYKKATDDK